MWGLALSRTFEYVEPPERHTMHGSLHLIYATESDRSRRAQGEQARLASTFRRPLGRMIAAAHGIPPRAAPGTDSRSLGRHAAASLRGR